MELLGQNVQTFLWSKVLSQFTLLSPMNATFMATLPESYTVLVWGRGWWCREQVVVNRENKSSLLFSCIHKNNSLPRLLHQVLNLQNFDCPKEVIAGS